MEWQIFHAVHSPVWQEKLFFVNLFIVFGEFMQQNAVKQYQSLRIEGMDMHTTMSASSSKEAGNGYPREAQVRHPSVRRLKAIGYLALLLAVVPAAACIATGHAGVPVLFSTTCGVVSCVAPPGSVPGW
jgi:hypothetical protein